MSICNLEDCEHYACILRRKGIQVSPRIGMATATRNWRPTKSVPPASNAAILYDERPGGIKVPIYNPNGTLVRGKQAYEQRRKITSTIRRMRNSAPSP